MVETMVATRLLKGDDIERLLDDGNSVSESVGSTTYRTQLVLGEGMTEFAGSHALMEVGNSQS
jgi:hypothetical protein